MSENDMSLDLSGKMLIAMPGMGDPRFDRSVVFLCAHSPEGAMGLIVNKPALNLSFSELLSQLGIETAGIIDVAARAEAGRTVPARIHVGGPVEPGRGFVLHSADYGIARATLEVDDRFGMTATLEILEDMARGRGSSRTRSRPTAG